MYWTLKRDPLWVFAGVIPLRCFTSRSKNSSNREVAIRTRRTLFALIASGRSFCVRWRARRGVSTSSHRGGATTACACCAKASMADGKSSAHVRSWGVSTARRSTCASGSSKASRSRPTSAARSSRSRARPGCVVRPRPTPSPSGLPSSGSLLSLCSVSCSSLQPSRPR